MKNFLLLITLAATFSVSAVDIVVEDLSNGFLKEGWTEEEKADATGLIRSHYPSNGIRFNRSIPLSQLWVQKFYDLSTYENVTLSFNYRGQDVDPNGFDSLGIYLSNDGGINWDFVDIIGFPLTSSESYDLTPYISTETGVRFAILNGFDDANAFGFIEDIVLSTPFDLNEFPTGWIEIDDDNDPNTGNIFVVENGFNLDDRPNSGGEPKVYKIFDLSGYTSANLSFDLETSGNLENSDRFDVSVSSDGGSTYTVLESFNDEQTLQTLNYDITPYLSDSTGIRFRVENAYGGGGESVTVTNIIIDGLE